MSSESRNDLTVAGMLRETISLNVALILADAKSANNEPTTVRPAASPKAKYRRARIVLSQERGASRAGCEDRQGAIANFLEAPSTSLPRTRDGGLVTALPS